MSFELSPKRPVVAFDITTGQEVDAQPDDAKCKLDIHSNLAIDMGGMGYRSDACLGNYSTWVDLQANEGVAVTGLTSCGAVFLANSDFSKVAAGHMSGDAQFFDDWCRSLLRTQTKPAFLLWGTGTTGSRSRGGKMLMAYMKAFGLSPSRAPAVASCGAIFLVRSTRGLAFASQDVRLPFQAIGQAVRDVVLEHSPLTRLLIEYAGYKNYDEAGDLVNAYLLIKTLAASFNEDVGFDFDEEAQTEVIKTRGPTLIKRYAKTVAEMPSSYLDDFKRFNLFKRFPELKL